jgi:glutamine amidotransferase
MCRHLAYVGPPVPLSKLVLDPSHSLLRQAYEPARQKHGVVNADGFGVGWYADWAPPGTVAPARYRRALPMWADESFRTVAGAVRSGAVLAAVRDATPGQPHGEAAVAPLGEAHWLFSHNGVIAGWPDSATELVEGLSPAVLLALPVLSDSTLLWAMVAERLAKGMPAGEALVTVVEMVATKAGGRLNLLLHDGTTVTATAWGDSLFCMADESSAIVASEPYDDDAGWFPVLDRSVVLAQRGDVQVHPIS